MTKPHRRVIRRGPVEAVKIDRYHPFESFDPDTKLEQVRCGVCNCIATVTETGRLHAHRDSRDYECPNTVGPGDRNIKPDAIAEGLALLDSQAEELLAAYRRPIDERRR